MKDLEFRARDRALGILYGTILAAEHAAEMAGWLGLSRRLRKHRRRVFVAQVMLHHARSGLEPRAEAVHRQLAVIDGAAVAAGSSWTKLGDKPMDLPTSFTRASVVTGRCQSPPLGFRLNA